jgi:hypothetical protein
LQEAIGQEAFAVRARQAPRPDGPYPAAVCSDRRILRDCASFSGGMAMGRSLGAFGTIAPLLSHCASHLLCY